MTRIFNYEILALDKAEAIVRDFNMNSQYYNCYWTFHNQIKHAVPLLIRESVDFLKHDVPEKIIYVLALRTTTNKLSSSKSDPITSEVA